MGVTKWAKQLARQAKKDHRAGLTINLDRMLEMEKTEKEFVIKQNIEAVKVLLFAIFAAVLMFTLGAINTSIDKLEARMDKVEKQL